MRIGVLGARDLLSHVNQAVSFNNTSDVQYVSVNICNRNSNTTSISLAISTSETTPLDSEWIEYGTTIIAYGTFERTQIVLPPNYYILLRSSQSNVNVVCYGIGYGDDTVAIPTIANNVADGSTKGKAAVSASAIKTLTGTNTDGVYWIQPSPGAPAQQVYCIMDSTWDGGGWMIVAHNNALNTLSSALYQPRLTSNTSLVGSTGADSYSSANTFSINVRDYPISKLAWCAYTSTWKNITTYIYGTFNSPKYIPDSTAYVRVFDNYHLTLPWLSATDIRTRPLWNDPPTNNSNSFSAIALDNGNRGDTTFGVYSPSVMVAARNAQIAGYNFQDQNSTSYNISGIFSWSDTTTNGWDDYQNGNSLGDAWGTATTVNFGRGLPSYIMVK